MSSNDDKETIFTSNENAILSNVEDNTIVDNEKDNEDHVDNEDAIQEDKTVDASKNASDCSEDTSDINSRVFNPFDRKDSQKDASDKQEKFSDSKLRNSSEGGQSEGSAVLDTKINSSHAMHIPIVTTSNGDQKRAGEPNTKNEPNEFNDFNEKVEKDEKDDKKPKEHGSLEYNDIRSSNIVDLSPIPEDDFHGPDSYYSDLSDEEFVECNDEIAFLETPMKDTDEKKQFEGGHLEWRDEIDTSPSISLNISQGELPEEEILKGFVVKNLDDGTESNLYDHIQKAHPFFTQLVMRDKINLKDEAEEHTKGPEKKGGLKFMRSQSNRVPESQSESNSKPVAPNHIQVSCKGKKYKQFTDLRAVESIVAHDGAIWCMEFSVTGDYLATAGQDGSICIWKVKKQKYSDESLEKGKDLRDNNSFISTSSTTPSAEDELQDKTPRWISKRPIQLFKSAQRTDVVALAWSKKNFLISSSMDHRVSVWHVTRKECLVSFKHNELVTSVAFHPEDDSLFVTGSFDEKLRLFNLRNRELVSFVDTKSMITAVGFAEQGKTLIVGTYDGKCIFYNVRGNELSKRTSIDVRSRRGKNKGRKVTGVVPSPDQLGVLVTTNDSRIRLYSLVDFSEICKFKGLVNTSSQIKASYNLDGSQIISGSENYRVYIWSVQKELNIEKKKLLSLKKKSVIDSYESFRNSDSTVTNCLFAPFQFAYPTNIKSTYGSIIATSNYKGELCIYESLGNPELL